MPELSSPMPRVTAGSEGGTSVTTGSLPASYLTHWNSLSCKALTKPSSKDPRKHQGFWEGPTYIVQSVTPAWAHTSGGFLGCVLRADPCSRKTLSVEANSQTNTLFNGQLPQRCPSYTPGASAMTHTVPTQSRSPPLRLGCESLPLR